MIEVDLFELLICILLASFGGIVKRLVDMEKYPKRRVTITEYISAALISLFVGIVMYAICKYYNVAPFLIISLVSIAGFFGAPVMNIIADFSIRQIRFVNKESVNDILETAKREVSKKEVPKKESPKKEVARKKL